jgi:hypothetical protein
MTLALGHAGEGGHEILSLRPARRGPTEEEARNLTARNEDDSTRRLKLLALTMAPATEGLAL